MKHLNRIIFINSASMRYEELELDGNIHLSGFSGAGKTTIERAILYFFTADQRNLGIDLNSQETFVQHYFASGDSHIVYEVKKDDGAFCVILTNSENRIQYAFVDSPYRKEWIVDPVTRMVSSSWSEITKNIPQHIDRDLVINIKDYIEILWGCHRDHKYARYMLAESKGYDNLLKSLKNVFLHSGFSYVHYPTTTLPLILSSCGAVCKIILPYQKICRCGIRFLLKERTRHASWPRK